MKCHGIKEACRVELENGKSKEAVKELAVGASIFALESADTSHLKTVVLAAWQATMMEEAARAAKQATPTEAAPLPEAAEADVDDDGAMEGEEEADDGIDDEEEDPTGDLAGPDDPDVD